MSRNVLAMPVSGRTAGGKAPDLSAEDHTVSRLKNFIDGLAQNERKAVLKQLGFDRPIDPTAEEIEHRLKKGVTDFQELVEKSGGEKLPGCGSILILDVGSRVRGNRDDPRVLSEDKAQRRLRALSRVNYRFGKRGGKNRRGKVWKDKTRKVWPGLIKQMVSFSPGDSLALMAAVATGVMTAAELVENLAVLGRKICNEIRKSTKLPGAMAGLEAEILVYHMEQGSLHAHVYLRDVDITDASRGRLGLFGVTSAPRKTKPKPRLTLNSLGVSSVAMRRHRVAGHAPIPMTLLGEDGQVGLCSDWRILEAAEIHRAKKELGPCWDVTVSDLIDNFWSETFSRSPQLKKCWEEGHAKWRQDWNDKCAAKTSALKALAKEVLGAEVVENDDRLTGALKEIEKLRVENESVRAKASRLQAMVGFERLQSQLERKLAKLEKLVLVLLQGRTVGANDPLLTGLTFESRPDGKLQYSGSFDLLLGPEPTNEIKERVEALKKGFMEYERLPVATAPAKPPTEKVIVRTQVDPTTAANLKVYAERDLKLLVHAANHVRACQRGHARPLVIEGILEESGGPGGIFFTSAFYDRVAEARKVLGVLPKEFSATVNWADAVASFVATDFEHVASLCRLRRAGRSISSGDEAYFGTEVDHTVPVVRAELREAAEAVVRSADDDSLTQALISNAKAAARFLIEADAFDREMARSRPILNR